MPHVLLRQKVAPVVKLGREPHAVLVILRGSVRAAVRQEASHSFHAAKQARHTCTRGMICTLSLSTAGVSVTVSEVMTTTSSWSDNLRDYCAT